jgi:hypothetical protein
MPATSRRARAPICGGCSSVRAARV